MAEAKQWMGNMCLILFVSLLLLPICSRKINKKWLKETMENIYAVLVGFVGSQEIENVNFSM